jgi:hypothetical protein
MRPEHVQFGVVNVITQMLPRVCLLDCFFLKVRKPDDRSVRPASVYMIKAERAGLLFKLGLQYCNSSGW